MRSRWPNSCARPETVEGRARQDRRRDNRRAHRVDEDARSSKPDGEKRPRLESWENTASHLRRFLGPRLGKKLATRDHQAGHRDALQRHRRGQVRQAVRQQRAPHAQGRHRACSTGRRKRAATTSPPAPASTCRSSTPEHPRTRVLSEDEIRIFWHGLDRNDLPWDRRTRLALKFELVTMLRST